MVVHAWTWFAKAWLADVWLRFWHRKMIDLFNFLQDDDFPIIPRFLVVDRTQ